MSGETEKTKEEILQEKIAVQGVTIHELQYGIRQWQSKVKHMEQVIADAEMSLRDEFALSALNGLIATDRPPTGFNEEPDVSKRRGLLARAAYDYADKMLKIRDKG